MEVLRIRQTCQPVGSAKAAADRPDIMAGPQQRAYKDCFPAMAVGRRAGHPSFFLSHFLFSGV